MNTPHQHAAAIDRIGRASLYSHFNVTRQAVDRWKREGIPKMHINSVAMLAARLGKPVPELGVKDSVDA
jgi:hypothetical protein